MTSEPHTAQPDEVAAADSESLLSWRAHPFRERPGAGIAAMLICIALCVGAWQLADSINMAFVGAALLVLGLNRFFFPSKFTIDADGMTASFPLRRSRMRWAEVRRIVHDENGVYLSRRPMAGRADGFTGMHIRYGRESGERVLGLIRRSREHAQAQVPEGAAAV